MKSEDELRRILNTYPRDELRKVIAGTNITNVSRIYQKYTENISKTYEINIKTYFRNQNQKQLKLHLC